MDRSFQGQVTQYIFITTCIWLCMNQDYVYLIIWFEIQRVRKHQQQTKAAAIFFANNVFVDNILMCPMAEEYRAVNVLSTYFEPLPPHRIVISFQWLTSFLTTLLWHIIKLQRLKVRVKFSNSHFDLIYQGILASDFQCAWYKCMLLYDVHRQYKTKRKRSDSVIWQTPKHPQNNPKSIVTT